MRYIGLFVSKNHNNRIRGTLTINTGNLTSKGNCSMDPNTLNDVCSNQIDTRKSCKNPTDELAYQTKLIITKNKTKLFHEQNQSSKPSLKVTSCTQYIPVFLSFLLCALRWLMASYPVLHHSLRNGSKNRNIADNIYLTMNSSNNLKIDL